MIENTEVLVWLLVYDFEYNTTTFYHLHVFPAYTKQKDIMLLR